MLVIWRTMVEQGSSVREKKASLRQIAPNIIHQFFGLFSGVAIIQHAKGTKDDGDGQEKQQFHDLYS